MDQSKQTRTSRWGVHLSNRLWRTAPWSVSALFLLPTGLALSGATTGVSYAQTITASVRGTVTDPSGAAIADASIVATNVETGVTYPTRSNGDGLYSLRFLPVGRYSIHIAASGFADEQTKPFQLEIAQEATINISTHVKSESASVTVNIDTAPILNSENPMLATTVSREQIESMPMTGRDFTAATVAIPGSIHSGGQMNEEPGVNGNRQETNSFLLDGMDIYNQMNGVGFNNNSGAAYLPNPDALQEVRVITSNANAEFSNVNGGQVIALTKSGTNNFHGGAFAQLENYKMNANTWNNKHTSGRAALLNPYTQTYFGGHVGGPIIKDTLFFFGDFQAYRNHAHGGQMKSTVIPAAWRTGDFSSLLDPTVMGANTIQLYDANGNAFVRNQLPVQNPVAKFLFANPAAYPLPNATPDDKIAHNNYVGPSSNINRTNQGDAKIDWKAGSRDSLSARYSMMRNQNGTSAVAVPATFPFSFGAVAYTSFVLNEIHTFSNNAVNEFRAGFGRNTFLSGSPTDPSGLFGTSGNQKVGLSLPQAVYVGFTQQQFGSSPMNSVGDSGIGQYFALNNFLYGDDFSLQLGRHLIKVGAQFIRYQQNFFYGGNAGALGTMKYSGAFAGRGAGGYSDVADFALGYVNQIESDYNAGSSISPSLFGQRQWRDGFFVQDDYKVTPRLTLNLGVRYDYSQPIYEVHNRETNINPQTGAFEYAGQNGNSRALYNPTYNQFAPRVGFAYSVNPRIVVRGGYGITTYFEGMGVGLRLTQNPPWQQVYTLNAIAPSTSGNGTPLAVTTGLPTQGNNTNGNTFMMWDPNMRPSLTQGYSLTSEFQLDNHSSLQVGYVGNQTDHLTIPVWANQWPSSCAGASTCAAAPFAKSPALGDKARIKETATLAMSNYNALQVVFRRHAYKGLDFTANYTWSKAMTNGGQGFNGIFGGDTNWYQQDAYNLAAEYGPSPLDATHNLSAVLVYAIPVGIGRQFGSSMNRAADLVIGGWKISGLGTYFSGNPISLGSPNNYGGQVFSVGSDRPNYLHPMKVVNRSLNNWFGTDASATPCIWKKVGTVPTLTGDANTCAYSSESFTGFGTARNGSQRGPGFQQVDLSLFKGFTVYRENVVEFRADFFNAFNLASYGNPDGNVSDSNFGAINNSRLDNPRTLQLGLNYKF